MSRGEIQPSYKKTIASSNSLLLASPVAHASETPNFDPVQYLDKSKMNSFGGAQAQPVGVGTMASRARPVTGVRLVPDTLTSGKSTVRKNWSHVSAELKPTGKGGNVIMQFDSPWKLKTGMFYDVECRGDRGEGCYVVEVGVPDPSNPSSISSSIVNLVTDPKGRFGANGGVGNVKVLSTKASKSEEFTPMEVDVEFTFDALSPAMRELPRRVKAR